MTTGGIGAVLLIVLLLWWFGYLRVVAGLALGVVAWLLDAVDLWRRRGRERRWKK